MHVINRSRGGGEKSRITIISVYEGVLIKSIKRRGVSVSVVLGMRKVRVESSEAREKRLAYIKEWFRVKKDVVIGEESHEEKRSRLAKLKQWRKEYHLKKAGLPVENVVTGGDEQVDIGPNPEIILLGQKERESEGVEYPRVTYGTQAKSRKREREARGAEQNPRQEPCPDVDYISQAGGDKQYGCKEDCQCEWCKS